MTHHTAITRHPNRGGEWVVFCSSCMWTHVVTTWSDALNVMDAHRLAVVDSGQ